MSNKQALKLQQIEEKISEGLRTLYQEEGFKNYLKTMSKFHQYSFRNILLISLQKPEATYVAGFNTWKTLERNVKQGSKGIQILAPQTRKLKQIEVDENNIETEKEIQWVSFKPVYVFDISQTEGKPLPKLDISPLEERVEHFEKNLLAFLRASDAPILFNPIESKAKGQYSPTEHLIIVSDSLSPLHTLSTTIHEMVHATLHNRQNLRVERETQLLELEAEGCAFVVCDYFGFDTKDKSFPYLGTWAEGQDIGQFQGVLENIQIGANTLITKINQQFEMLKEPLDYKKELTKEIEVQRSKAALQKERLDYLLDDNDIDLDREKTLAQLGFKEYNYIQHSNEELVLALASYFENDHELSIDLNEIKRSLIEPNRYQQLVDILDHKVEKQDSTQLVAQAKALLDRLRMSVPEPQSLKEKLSNAKQRAQFKNQQRSEHLEKSQKKTKTH